jgi:hypothetical protein
VNPFKYKPIILTAKNTHNDKNKVTTKELVTVKVNGNKPILLQNNKTKNKKKTNPALTCFDCKTLSLNIPITNSHKDDKIQKKKAKESELK